MLLVMQTIEQFSDQLLSRWKELHPEYKKPVKEEPKVKGLLSYPPEAGGTRLCLVDDENISNLAGITEDVFKRAKKKLRDPITWVGPIAVGEEKNLRGWWAVVLPNSATQVSFFGPLARKRAIEKAELLRKDYE